MGDSKSPDMKEFNRHSQSFYNQHVELDKNNKDLKEQVERLEMKVENQKGTAAGLTKQVASLNLLHCRHWE